MVKFNHIIYSTKEPSIYTLWLRPKGEVIEFLIWDGGWKPIGTSSSSIIVDDRLDPNSLNPIANKTVYEALKAENLNLPKDVVRAIEQTFTEEEKTQILKNIGAQKEGNYATKEELKDKQDTLVSGTNIKTVNGQSLLGEGNIVIEGGSGNIDRPSTDNQMGYKVLTADTSLLEQITEANTIYEIRTDFDLKEGTLEVPENCILKFEGGKIKNGTITGNKTKIDASIVQIFESIKFSGNFINDAIYAEWWGAESYYLRQLNIDSIMTRLPSEIYELPDCADAFNAALDFCGRYSSGYVKAAGTIYHVASTITIPAECSLVTDESTIFAADMQGDGLTIVTHDEETFAFSKETLEENVYLVKSNQFIDTNSMAVIFKVGARRTSFIGRGNIDFSKSRYTIAMLIEGDSYNGLDMSFRSPYIDIRTCGGWWGQYTIDSTIDEIVDYDPTDTDLNESGKTKKIWNKTNKRYYTKNNGETSWKDNGVYDNNFNTAIRFDIGKEGQSLDYRVINPYIVFGDIYGFRGLEIYTHDKGWFNISTMIGTISNKFGTNISIFTDRDVVDHDWSRMNFQVGIMNWDSKLFYANKAGIIKIGGPSDLAYSVPNIETAYYLGKGTYQIELLNIERLRYIIDYGKDNKYLQHLNISDEQSASGVQFSNILSKRYPIDAYIIQNAKNKIIKDSFVNKDSFEQFINDIVLDENNDLSYLYDDDINTYETVIDTEAGVFGTVLMILEFNSPYSKTQPWLEVDYTIEGEDLENYDNSIFAVFGPKAGLPRLDTYSVFFKKEGDTANGSNKCVNKKFIPLNIDGTPGYCKLGLIATSNLKIKLKVFAIKLWTTSYRSDKTYKKSIFTKGEIQVNGNTPKINVGDCKNNDFIDILTSKTINHGTSETTKEIEPNILHVWGEIETLNLTFSSDNGEYMIQFESGYTPTVLTLPDTVKWANDNTIVANRIYQVSILNNIAIIGGVDK